MMILKLHQRPAVRVKASISTAGVIKKTTIMVAHVAIGLDSGKQHTHI